MNRSQRKTTVLIGRAVGLSILAAVTTNFTAQAAQANDSPSIENLSRMSLQELTSVQVTSVSKSPEPWRAAPAAIYVITHDELVRSGATSIPEALRLAPNLAVTQLTSSGYAAGARGFGGAPDAQNFANKLLILIDGRSVYTPLFSGVYYDAQDVLMQDVDRIEVISGPGATLWGANAMNGVVNIITRPAYLTDGLLLTAGAGNLEESGSARYGGKLNDEIAYRVYGKGFRRGAQELADGRDAEDDWYKGQAGFRLDWSRASDVITLQGDVYRGLQNQGAIADGLIIGANVLTRWRHHGDRSDLQVQAYFDQTQRAAPAGGVAFVLHTYDLEIQQSIAAGSHKIVLGAGGRINSYSIHNSASLQFIPSSRRLTLGNLFAQDTIALGDSFKLTLGVKLEDNSYSGWEVLPDARLAFELNETNLLWGAASRAIRAPTPFDRDVVEILGTTVFLTGNSNFQPEVVNAYEVGYRTEPTESLALSVSVFYNDYDDLRSIEPEPAVFLPLRWDNLMAGHTSGVTAWAKWQIADWWRLTPGFTTLRKQLRFKAGAVPLLGESQAGNDPKTHVSLTSSMDLRHNVTFDASLRYVGALPDPELPAYRELTAHLGWRVSDNLEVSLSGLNLLHARHMEYAAPAGESIGRSVFAEALWKFQ